MGDHPLLTGWSGQPCDRSALVAAYDQYHLPLYRYIYHQVGEVEAARDLTAETFRHLLVAIQQGHGPRDHLKAWLYRTAHNLVIDYYRRQKHRAHLPLDEELLDSHHDPVISAEAHLLAQEVRGALQQLTPDQQQVIVLKYLEGLSNPEVAALLDKPIGAIKSLQHRALVALRSCLARFEEKVSYE